jgi:hypothetical protein
MSLRTSLSSSVNSDNAIGSRLLSLIQQISAPAWESFESSRRPQDVADNPFVRLGSQPFTYNPVTPSFILPVTCSFRNKSRRCSFENREPSEDVPFRCGGMYTPTVSEELRFCNEFAGSRDWKEFVGFETWLEGRRKVCVVPFGRRDL